MQIVPRLTPEQQAGVQALARAARDVDGVSPFGEHKWLRLTRGDDDVAAVLLWQGNRLIGAADCNGYHSSEPGCSCHLNAEMVVHPKSRRRGFGTLLLRGVLAVAEEQRTGEMHLWAYGNLPAARSVAAHLGCRPERTLLELALGAERLPDAPRCPDGVRLRPFSVQDDARIWLELHNRAFAEHPEQATWDASDLQARFGQPWFDPQDLLLAEDSRSGDLVGSCWVKLRSDQTAPGEIYIVGVDPSARGRGLGKLLVQAGLAHIRADGRPGAMLYVEADNAPALGLYRRLGFERRWEHVCYTRQLHTGGSRPEDAKE